MARSELQYRVEAELNAFTSVQEFSKVFEGLQALASTGAIDFRIDPSRHRGADRIMRLSVHDTDRGLRQIAIDIADDPQIGDLVELEAADIYFKRSLHPGTLVTIDPTLATKVRPFGLNNPAIRPASALKVLTARLRTGRSARELARDARQLLALPSPRAFEIPPETPADPMILFQTRLWSPATTAPGIEQINEERVELIRTLRSAFGERFVGGAVPTDFVREQFPDVVTSLPFSMRAYPGLLRRPLIAVYSKGLRDSLAFKMSEYLAATRCIVGHMPATILPRPLIQGEHLLGFTNADQCAAQCEALLSRPADANAMRWANWTYYREQVEPSAHLISVLHRAFADS